MVRDAGPLPPFRADPVRLFAAHPLAARQPRESAAARQGLAGGRRALVPVAGARARRSTSPPRRCSRRSGCADMELANRVVVSPMAMYSAEDGTPNDFHLVHYGARAQGGAGLLYTEMTCVSPEGRITPGCTGMYAPEHVEAWRRIVDFVHANQPGEILPPARPFRARRAAPKVGWEGYDVPLDERQLAGHGRLRRAVEPRQPGAAADDPRRHGRGDRASSSPRSGWASRPASTWSSSTPPTAICCRASSPRSPTSGPTNMAAASRTACASRSKCSARCAPPGRRTSRCRCASRPTTGWAISASRPTRRSRSAAPSPRPAPT